MNLNTALLNFIRDNKHTLSPKTVASYNSIIQCPTLCHP